MKIVIMGNHLPGIYALEYVLADGMVPLVVVPFRKKVQEWHASLFDFAQSKGIKKIYNPEDVNAPDFVEVLRDFEPDVLLSVYYDQIVKKSILDIPRMGCFNIHPALLPRYRGVAPLIWAIINGEKYTGVSLHRMVEKVDAGDIVIQEKIRINLHDTGFSLHGKAARKIKNVIPRFFAALKKGKIKYAPQRGKGSLYTSTTPKVNELNFKDNIAFQNYNIIRALTRPLPGAYFYFQGRKVYVWKARVVRNLDRSTCKEMGGLLFNGKEVFAICKNNTYLKLIEVESGLRNMLDRKK
jgi:UDP-4-amino-4-deoxy-L-arabinose formyltransferase/UDP-glucuronic acid dehydrogenase (UDP-4-keto-hexauronic acid decarboxylating)